MMGIDSQEWSSGQGDAMQGACHSSGGLDRCACSTGCSSQLSSMASIYPAPPRTPIGAAPGLYPAHSAWPDGNWICPGKFPILSMSRTRSFCDAMQMVREDDFLAQHYASQTARSSENLDITFTATTSASGSLLLGSSREFSGFGQSSPVVMQAILDRAAMFLPGLRNVNLSKVDVRVGLRPFAPRGLPYIGWMPGTDGVLIAAGHEGSGLTYGPATGEIIRRLILGEEQDQEFAENFRIA